jgi:hypothetical protein
MKKQYIVTGTVLLLFGLLVGNCSGSITRVDGITAPNYSEVKIGDGITMTYSDEAKGEVKASGVIDEGALLNVLKGRLIKSGLYADAGTTTIELKVTSARFRSEFTAFFWGIFAGSDSMEIELFVRDKSGKVIDRHTMTMSYGAGGLMGTNANRQAWFHTKIVELAMEQLEVVN